MTPDEVEQLFSSRPAVSTEQPHGDGKDGAEDDQPSLSNGETSSRTESLGRVLATVNRLREAGSEQLDVIAEKIGNGARDGEPHSNFSGRVSTLPLLPLSSAESPTTAVG